MTKSQVARRLSTRKVASLVGTRQTLASLVREVSQPETPDVCLHFGIEWRKVTPSPVDGRLYTFCSCGTRVSRSAFVS